MRAGTPQVEVRLRGSVAAGVVGKVAEAVTLVLLATVVPRLLGPSDYGWFSVALTVVAVGSLALTLGGATLLARYVPVAAPADRVATALALTRRLARNRAAAFAGLALLGAVLVLADPVRFPPLATALVLLALGLNVITTLLLQADLGLGRAGLWCARYPLQNAVLVAAVLALYEPAGGGAVVAIVLAGLAGCGLAAVALWSWRPVPRTPVGAGRGGELPAGALRFGWLQAGGGALTQLAQRGGVLAVALLVGSAEQTGFAALAVGIMLAATYAVAQLFTVALPVLARRENAAGHPAPVARRRRRCGGWPACCWSALTPTMIVSTLLLGPAVPLLFGTGYAGAVAAFGPALAAVVLAPVNALAVQAAALRLRPEVTLRAALVGAAAFLLAALAAVPAWGARGATTAALAATAATAATSVRLLPGAVGAAAGHGLVRRRGARSSCSEPWREPAAVGGRTHPRPTRPARPLPVRTGRADRVRPGDRSWSTTPPGTATRSPGGRRRAAGPAAARAGTRPGGGPQRRRRRGRGADRLLHRRRLRPRPGVGRRVGRADRRRRGRGRRPHPQRPARPRHRGGRPGHRHPPGRGHHRPGHRSHAVRADQQPRLPADVLRRRPVRRALPAGRRRGPGLVRPAGRLRAHAGVRAGGAGPPPPGADRRPGSGASRCATGAAPTASAPTTARCCGSRRPGSTPGCCGAGWPKDRGPARWCALAQLATALGMGLEAGRRRTSPPGLSQRQARLSRCSRSCSSTRPAPRCCGRLLADGLLPNLARPARTRRVAPAGRAGHPVRGRRAAHALQRRAAGRARAVLPVPVVGRRAAGALHERVPGAAADLGAARPRRHAHAGRRPVREPAADRPAARRAGLRLAAARPGGAAPVGLPGRRAPPAAAPVRPTAAGGRGVRPAHRGRDAGPAPPPAGRARAGGRRGRRCCSASSPSTWPG